MDVEKLIGEVAARNGIRIEPDDPAFALVTLNQLVLEEAVKNLVREIRAATADFESAAERVQSRVGAMLANGFWRRTDPLLHQYDSRWARARWFCGGALCAIAIVVITYCIHHWGLTQR